MNNFDLNDTHVTIIRERHYKLHDFVRLLIELIISFQSFLVTTKSFFLVSMSFDLIKFDFKMSGFIKSDKRF